VHQKIAQSHTIPCTTEVFFPAQFAFKIWNNFFSHTLLEGQLGGNTFNFEIQVRGEIKLITVFITVFSQ